MDITSFDTFAIIREASSVRFDAVWLCFGLIGLLTSALNHCSFLSWEASSSLPAFRSSVINICRSCCVRGNKGKVPNVDWLVEYNDWSQQGQYSTYTMWTHRMVRQARVNTRKEAQTGKQIQRGKARQVVLVINSKQVKIQITAGRRIQMFATYRPVDVVQVYVIGWWGNDVQVHGKGCPGEEDRWEESQKGEGSESGQIWLKGVREAEWAGMYKKEATLWQYPEIELFTTLCYISFLFPV